MSEMALRRGTWYRALLIGMTNPGRYGDLLHDPNVGISRAVGWLATALAGGMLIIFTQTPDLNATPLVCMMPMVVLVGVAGFMLYTGLTHGLVRLVRGTGRYRDLAYLYAAYHAPLLIVGAGLLPIPVVRWAGLGLALLALIFNVFAIRAVYCAGTRAVGTHTEGTHPVGWLPALIGGLWPAVLVVVVLALILAAGSAAVRL